MADESFDENQTAVATRDQSKIATPPTLVVDENLMRLARQFPRDRGAIMERAIADLKRYPQYADELFYSIPYQDKRKKLINFVEGPSIRATEHLWSMWGNCTIAARVADDRGNKIMVQGLYLDHETGGRLASDLEVSKMGHAKGGGTYPLNANDLRNKVAATESKVKRNAFLSALTIWEKDSYVQTCFDLSMGVSKKTIAERTIDAKVFFMSRFKITEEIFKDLHDRILDSYPGIDDKGVLRYLIGVKNGIKDGNIDPEFLFGTQKQAASMPQPKPKPSAPAAPAAPVATGDDNDAGDAQE